MSGDLSDRLRQMADDLHERASWLRESTHSDACWQWHDACALVKAADERESLLRWRAEATEVIECTCGDPGYAPCTLHDAMDGMDEVRAAPKDGGERTERRERLERERRIAAWRREAGR